jgi:hypothetical protein
VPMVEEPVTAFQPTAVVTENGMAELFGRPEHAQAAALIEHAAHRESEMSCGKRRPRSASPCANCLEPRGRTPGRSSGSRPNR